MKLALKIILAMTLLGTMPTLPAAPPPSSISFQQKLSKEGPYHVSSMLKDFEDASRSRIVPVKVYWPDNAPAKKRLPVIIFSHGLGGSREGYSYLGTFWASHGFICVHLQHKGSDSDVWKGSKRPLADMKQAAAKLDNAMQRPKDVSFAIDCLKELDMPGGILEGRVDMDRIGIGGHSFGAYTALASAGRSFVMPNGKRLTLGDKRIKAAIEMSAPVNDNDRSHLKESYETVSIPCMHMTGTKDSSIIADTPPADKVLPYESIAAPNQYLLVLEDGDHMVFSGRLPISRKKTDALHQDLIKRASLAFWMAFLMDDKDAKDYLESSTGFKGDLGSSGSYKWK